MKRFGLYLSVNLRDEELGGPQILLRAPTVLTVEQAKQLCLDMSEALLHASPSFVRPGMTRREAIKEATRRWGHPIAQGAQLFDRIEDTPEGSAARNFPLRYWVGVGDFGPLHGNGNSWEEAFADAGNRAKEMSLVL